MSSDRIGPPRAPALECERDEVQQKFELALQDVQRLRERVAEMEHDLARRPEADQVDSTELVSLRAERDTLARRIEELEQQPAASIDADVEQQLADLQRRFELAVEDVRDLKTKNAKLESQLVASKAGSPIPKLDAGGMDWESQKRRMLAALEGDDDSDPERQQERATIEATIEMTDAIVAEKDRQIAQLTAQLETARSLPVEGDDDRTRKISELIDADEIIAEHRKLSHQHEREMEAKLRAAELELSVERAKWPAKKPSSKNFATTSNHSGSSTNQPARSRPQVPRAAVGSRNLGSTAKTKSNRRSLSLSEPAGVRVS